MDKELRDALRRVIAHEADVGSQGDFTHHLIAAMRVSDDDVLAKFDTGWPHLAQAVRLRREDARLRQAFWAQAQTPVRDAFARFEVHVKLHHRSGIIAAELVPSSTKGYWDTTRPCRGLCEGRGTVHFHTVRYTDTQSGGRFTSPYETWRVLREYYTQAWPAVLAAAEGVDMDQDVLQLEVPA